MQKYKRMILLRTAICLLGILFPLGLCAQQITVKGVVKDATGETVIGASVVEKGTTNTRTCFRTERRSCDLYGAFVGVLDDDCDREIIG